MLTLIGLMVLVTVSITVIGLAAITWMPFQQHPGLTLLSPAIGAGIAATVLTPVLLAGPGLTYGVVAIVGLLAASALSIGLAMRRRLAPAHRLLRSEAAIGGAAVAPAALLATVPFLLKGSPGPSSLWDSAAWQFYASLANRLQRHGADELTPDPLWPTDQIAWLLPGGVRFGFEGMVGSFASIVGLSADRLLAPTAGALYVALAGVATALARLALRQGPRWAVLAGWLTAASVTLTPLFETSGPSLGAYALVPLFLWAFIRATHPRTALWTWAHTLAVVALAGLLSLYSEAVPFIVVGAVAILAGRALAAVRNPSVSSWSWKVVAAPLSIGAASLVLAPVSAIRAFRYIVETLGNLTPQPDWGVHLINLLPWLTGTQTLFEVRGFDDMGSGAQAMLISLALLIAGLAAVGVVRARPHGRMLLISGLGSIVAIGAWAYFAQDNAYGWYRAWCLAGPFLALATVVGIHSVWDAVSSQNAAAGTGRWLRIAVAAIIAVPLVATSWTSVRLAAATVDSPSLLTHDFTDVSEALRSLPGNGVLLEGTNSGPFPSAWAWSSAASQVVSRGEMQPVFTEGAAAWILGGVPARYSGDYDYVLTRFTGVSTHRKPVMSAGAFALMRRAPYDIALDTGGWSVNADEGAFPGQPNVVGPFRLDVSVPHAGMTAVRVRVEGDAVAGLSPSARTASGKPLAVAVQTAGDTGRAEWCLMVPVTESSTRRVDISPRNDWQPLWGLPAQTQPGETRSRHPGLLRITGLQAVPAGSRGCSAP